MTIDTNRDDGLVAGAHREPGESAEGQRSESNDADRAAPGAVQPLTKDLSDAAFRDFRAQVAASLVYHRVQSGQTREQVAAITGISERKIARWESGEADEGLRIYTDIGAVLGLRLVLRTREMGSL